MAERPDPEPDEIGRAFALQEAVEAVQKLLDASVFAGRNTHKIEDPIRREQNRAFQAARYRAFTGVIREIESWPGYKLRPVDHNIPAEKPKAERLEF